MQVTVNLEKPTYSFGEPRVGNVYNVRGGKGARSGHMQIILAIREPQDKWDDQRAIMLVVNRYGEPVGTASYSTHYFEDKVPIAFCDGIEDINLTIRSL